MTHWTDDTSADKAVRFAIGAFIGAGSGWGMAIKWRVQEVGVFVALMVLSCSVLGGLCVLFGNEMVEALVLGRRKE